MSSFSTNSAKFREFDVGNVILFQIKVFGRNISKVLHKYLVTAHHSFTQLTAIGRINRIH